MIISSSASRAQRGSRRDKDSKLTLTCWISGYRAETGGLKSSVKPLGAVQDSEYMSECVFGLPVMFAHCLIHSSFSNTAHSPNTRPPLSTHMSSFPLLWPKAKVKHSIQEKSCFVKMHKEMCKRTDRENKGSALQRLCSIVLHDKTFLISIMYFSPFVCVFLSVSANGSACVLPAGIKATEYLGSQRDHSLRV